MTANQIVIRDDRCAGPNGAQLKALHFNHAEVVLSPNNSQQNKMVTSMNTLQIDLTQIHNIARSLPDGKTIEDTRCFVAAPIAGVRSHDCVAAVPAPQATGAMRWLAHDPDSAQLVNFPFAFTVFMILIVGLSMVCWGLGIPSGSLALVGTLATLGGTFLYGWSLHDE